MSLRKVFNTLAAMVGLASFASQRANVVSQTPIIRPKKVYAPKVNELKELDRTGEQNPKKHQWGDLNQRQYRKLTRQCPWLRRSKKKRITATNKK